LTLVAAMVRMSHFAKLAGFAKAFDSTTSNSREYLSTLSLEREVQIHAL